MTVTRCPAARYQAARPRPIPALPPVMRTVWQGSRSPLRSPAGGAPGGPPRPARAADGHQQPANEHGACLGHTTEAGPAFHSSRISARLRPQAFLPLGAWQRGRARTPGGLTFASLGPPGSWCTPTVGGGR